jgi:hypothetical protein
MRFFCCGRVLPWMHLWVPPMVCSLLVLFFAWGSWTDTLAFMAQEKLPMAADRDYLALPYYDQDAVLYTGMVALEANSSNFWRVTTTHLDGGLEGRPMLMSQVLVWILVSLAGLVHLFSWGLGLGWGWVACVEFAVWFASPLLFCLSFFLLAGVVHLFRLGGPMVPVVSAATLLLWLSTLGVQTAFFAGRPDHHGLGALWLFLSFAGILFPLVTGRNLVAGAVLSGACAGLVLGPGLLFALPVFGVFFGALGLALLCSGGCGGGAGRYLPDYLWWLWGFVAAGTQALVLFLTHGFGPWPMRLEVGGPVWVVLLASGGIFLSALSSWSRSGYGWSGWGFWWGRLSRAQMGVLLLSLVGLGLGVAWCFLVGLVSFSLRDEGYARMLGLVGDLAPPQLGFHFYSMAPVLLLAVGGLVYMVSTFWGRWEKVLPFVLAGVLVFLLLVWASGTARVREVLGPVLLVVVLMPVAAGVCGTRLLRGGALAMVFWCAFALPTWLFGVRHFEDYQVEPLRHAAQMRATLPGLADQVVLSPPMVGPLYGAYMGWRNVGSMYWENLETARDAHFAMFVLGRGDFKGALRTLGVEGLLVPDRAVDLSSAYYFGESPQVLSGRNVWSSLREWKGEVGTSPLEGVTLRAAGDGWKYFSWEDPK